MAERKEIILLMGGNLGDTKGYFDHARRLIEQQVGSIVEHSEILSTEAWGFEASTTFLNQALKVRSTLCAERVLAEVLKIEHEVGRNRTREAQQRHADGQEYASRIIDIDIITYAQEVISLDRLTIPHKLMHRREFVLEPMAQIAASWQHPLLGRNTLELLKDLKNNTL
ncbi:MAG: 2-amino-4-hydroxy-6-hydroxymethyldihydropteridine diphosphokinase [Rikenellaceae bacterium]